MSVFVLKFNEIDREDIGLVGGKGANLGEMTRAGFPVPNGFCVTAQAYREMVKFNGFDSKIREMLDGVEVKDSDKLQRAADRIMKMVSKADIPDEMAESIIRHYRSLSSKTKNPLVAVRSSATAEDLPEASFAGQQSTFLDIKGEAAVIQAVRDAWASLFTARAIFYRETNGFDHFQVALAVPVQLMVASEVSGNMFTINPVNNDKRIIVIEAIWGLGEMIVQGTYTPDHYEVRRDDMTIYAREINEQKKELTRKNGVNKEYPLPKWKVGRQKLEDDLIVKLAEIGEKLHSHYRFPQDIEWAMEGGKLYVVQTRPITTMEAVERQSEMSLKEESSLRLLVKGDAASPGVAWGRPVVLKSAKEISKIKEGDVLVAEMTTPDFVPAMKRAVAIVTNSGGQTSHAAIVSRELGVPAVVGSKDGTKVLKKEKLITVNGTTGEVFAGKPKEQDLKYTKRDIGAGLVETATKVYVNLGEPELASSVAQKNVDGVGLLRAEFMMAQIGKHPKKMLRDGKRKEYVRSLAVGLAQFASSFGSRPVVYRASDFKTNEYQNLIGGKDFERPEPNPMLGYRGALRYITDEQVFEMELEAIKMVRDKLGYKNLWLMIPFVHEPNELLKVKRIVAANGLSRSSSFKLWMMVEIPSNVILLEEFAKAGIDGISIGSNDLTMLTLGVDRDNEDVAGAYDERNPAVLWMLETAIKKAVKLGLTASLCGQAASQYPDLVEKLVRWGITSVSVSPDAVERTREIVAQAEKRVIGGK
ncbi:phosphoenolpyruvate synthase [Candidatus Chazhemtobacterium aquaticus]|uniref:Phosphoenolpyruvate synthase n=1 Tax=Candidatus Chazhemtobacterium aquaticus TaxID=2715735 RepID=A0A857NHP7_9BACT|nr:phosphoenolpyruvate synthase [Candidatus Chazhemtobacterium aquaticus]QHO63608.1 Phosphoenolpyruvate synthase [Candidatus Chazhemtobacterium aquaticus]